MEEQQTGAGEAAGRPETETPRDSTPGPSLGRIVLILPIGEKGPGGEMPAIVNGVEESGDGFGTQVCARGFPKSGDPVQFTGLRQGSDADVPEPNTWRWPPRAV
jgi:hypothetical protein